MNIGYLSDYRLITLKAIRAFDTSISRAIQTTSRYDFAQDRNAYHKLAPENIQDLMLMVSCFPEFCSNNFLMMKLFFNVNYFRTYIRPYGKRHLSRLMGKPTICIGENKDADQLRGNREADQRLCFRYSDSTIPLLLKSEISSF